MLISVDGAALNWGGMVQPSLGSCIPWSGQRIARDAGRLFAAKSAVNKAVIHRTRDSFEAPDSNLFRVGDFIGLGPGVALRLPHKKRRDKGPAIL